MVGSQSWTSSDLTFIFLQQNGTMFYNVKEGTQNHKIELNELEQSSRPISAWQREIGCSAPIKIQISSNSVSVQVLWGEDAKTD